MSAHVDVREALAAWCNEKNIGREEWLRRAAVESPVAELIAADLEYDAARRDWDHVTAHDPEETSDETWRRVADRFESAVMRRIAALDRCVGAS